MGATPLRVQLLLHPQFLEQLLRENEGLLALFSPHRISQAQSPETTSHLLNPCLLTFAQPRALQVKLGSTLRHTLARGDVRARQPLNLQAFPGLLTPDTVSAFGTQTSEARGMTGCQEQNAENSPRVICMLQPRGGPNAIETP